jgi:hypothetical protein
LSDSQRWTLSCVAFDTLLLEKVSKSTPLCGSDGIATLGSH